jgi:hypothetical protein
MLDNAVIESWHSTVEFELRRAEHFATKTAARAGVAAWIEDYVRHEAPLDRVEVRDLRRLVVAAAR